LGNTPFIFLIGIQAQEICFFRNRFSHHLGAYMPWARVFFC
jgi:hypothetical protein